MASRLILSTPPVMPLPLKPALMRDRFPRNDGLEDVGASMGHNGSHWDVVPLAPDNTTRQHIQRRHEFQFLVHAVTRSTRIRWSTCHLQRSNLDGSVERAMTGFGR